MFFKNFLLQAAVWLGIWALPMLTGIPLESTAMNTQITVQLVLMAALFNLAYFWLLPHLYFQEKKRLFWLFSIGLLAFLAFVNVQVGVHLGIDREMLARLPEPPGLPDTLKRPFPMLFFPPIALNVIVFAVAFGIRASMEYEKKKQEEKESNRQRLEAELALLKSQTNPHFLLNSLNTIYALAGAGSERTAEAVMRLSDMVRYILYEGNQPFVPLGKEVEYLQNYVALQKLRLPANVAVDFDARVTEIQLPIEPMLLITFVENAFKHGVSTATDCSISVKLVTARGGLQMRVKNRVFQRNAGQTDVFSGLGLANTVRRLTHNYPNRHELHIKNDGSTHLVELDIQLKNELDSH